MSGVARRTLPATAVVVTWVALWGEVTVGNVVGGIAVAALVVAATDAGRPRAGRLRPVHAARFLAHMAWSLVQATTLVAWEVVTPRNRIVEGIIAVPLPGATPTVVTVVSNAIGLTPGTVVVEIDDDPCVLYVHVLHLFDVERVRADLVHLEVLALRAFGSDESLVAADRLEAAR